MIDTIVKVSEKLVELLKYREARNEKRFKETLEPFFLALVAVHSDYLNMFQGVEIEALGTASLQEISDAWAVRRLTEEATRRTVQSLAEALSQRPANDAESAFFDSVNRYFLIDYGSGSGSGSVFIEHALWDDDEEKEAKRVRENLAPRMRAGLIELRARWSAVTHTYAEVVARHAAR